MNVFQIYTDSFVFCRTSLCCQPTVGILRASETSGGTTLTNTMFPMKNRKGPGIIKLTDCNEKREVEPDQRFSAQGSMKILEPLIIPRNYLSNRKY